MNYLSSKNAQVNLDNSIAAALTATADQYDRIMENPAARTVQQTVLATVEGLKLIWAHEAKHQSGRQFVLFLWAIFTHVVMPVIALAFLALTEGYKIARNPETHKAIAARYRFVKGFFSKDSANTEPAAIEAA
jgi:hypothetical protein